MKIVAFGDLHGNPYWKEGLKKHEDADYTVFMGDYFDSKDYITKAQIKNFEAVMTLKSQHPDKVITLTGNHDLPYILKQRPAYFGYQIRGRYSIEPVIEEYKSSLQIACRLGKYMFSHAGISPLFINEHFEAWTVDAIPDLLNSLFNTNPAAFSFHPDGTDPSGDNVFQTPLWIRPQSLMSANKDHEIATKVIQVVGHTRVEQPVFDFPGYAFIDSMNMSGCFVVLFEDRIEIDDCYS